MANRTDNFNRANESPLGTPSDAGAAWVSVSGTIAVVSNVGAVTAAEAISYLEASTADGDVVAKIVTGLTSSHILGRVTDTNNFLLITAANATTLTLFKKVASNWTEVISVGSLTLALDDTIGIRMAGNQVTMLHNGSTVGAAQTVNDFTAVTKHGIRFDNSGSVDDFAFTAAVVAPTVSSATVLTEGNVLRMVFSESVTIGAGGNGGVTVTPSGGAATATYASGSGTNTLNYTLSRTLATSETLTRTYVQPGNGIEATSGGADVASFTTQAVTNNTINAPTIGTATATGTDAIDLTWTDNASNETQFEVEYDTADTFDVDPQTLLVDTADVESTEAANLDPPGTEWFLRVRAKNGNGVSLWSDDVSATTDPEVSPEEETRISSPAGWLRRRRLKF
jgi:hypothetical protein